MWVQLPTGEIVPVEVPPGTDPASMELPGPIVPPPTTTEPPASPETPTTPAPEPPPPGAETTSAPEPTPAPGPAPATPQPGPAPAPVKPAPERPDGGPGAGGGSPQERSNSGVRIGRDKGEGGDRVRKQGGRVKAERGDERSPERRRGRRPRLRNDDGTPSRNNPGFIDALPGPSTATGVPNFIIRKFRVPPFLLLIYQAAGIEYGIRWEVLAAINEIETDYGRNLNVSSAGALGWMQFMPATWRTYGVDANKDGRKDPYNPVDAIFAAARYLKAANYENDVRAAIWAYNHADWYVDSVLLRARLIAGCARRPDRVAHGAHRGPLPRLRAREVCRRPRREGTAQARPSGENAAHVIESSDDRRSIDIFANKGAPVVAVNDGVDQGGRPLEGARPPRRAPGRLREPLHLRPPRRGLQVLPGAQKGRRPGARADRKGREGQRRGRPIPGRACPPPPAASSTTPTPPPGATAARMSSRMTPRRPGRRSRSACSPIRTFPARARQAGSSSSWRRWRARAASSRPTGTSSRVRSASIRARSGCAPSGRARG